MINALVEIVIIIIILVASMSVLSIVMAYILFLLDQKGIFEKITKLFTLAHNYIIY